MVYQRCLVALLIICLGTEARDAVAADMEIPEAIFNYVSKEEPDFGWKKETSLKTDAGTVHQLEVTSQKWHDIVWKHVVEVYEPVEMKYADHALIFVTGGSHQKRPSEDDMKQGLQLADLCGARVVMLRQVPNQPLFGGRVEDDLITETWLRYLDTGDETWPLLFPMVKSAVKTMDAIQQFAMTEGSSPVKHFVITGASKRGWTSWLTPVVDERIVGTAPIVIDVLNFRAQMAHQLNSWGRFSDQIIDYTSKGLVRKPDETESPREVQLRQMMDPFTYRQKLTLPKLLIVGTNDPYWVVDSMNLYWNDLNGRRFVRQVPNAGHGLQGGRDGALKTLAVFFRHLASNSEMPDIQWQFTNGNGNVKLAMNSSLEPGQVRIWRAQSADMDFRDDEWKAESVAGSGRERSADSPLPKTGHLAVFGELEFQFDGIPWSLTTLVHRQ